MGNSENDRRFPGFWAVWEWVRERLRILLLAELFTPKKQKKGRKRVQLAAKRERMSKTKPEISGLRRKACYK